MLNSLKLFNRRKNRTRAAIRKSNKSSRIRLSIFRSNCHIYAQLIDDEKSITLASASTIDKDIKNQISKTSNIQAAELIGKKIAEKAKIASIMKVVFDKGGYVYHGRVKALAEAARACGLEF